MIKKCNRNVNCGYFDGTNYVVTCWTVVDEAATAAKIAECENGWQAEIETCDAQIDAYKSLKDNLNDKIKEAEALKSEFGTNTEKFAAANVNHPKTDLAPCSECVDELVQTYNNMVTQCDNEIDAWQAKKSAALEKKNSCPADTPKVYTTVCG
jgi:hypothetical protein